MQQQANVAIDFGYFSKVAYNYVEAQTAGSASTTPTVTFTAPELVTNEVSNHSTPTMLSFQNRERHIGESALNQMNLNAANTVTDLHKLIGKPAFNPAEFDHLMYKVGREAESVHAMVTIGERGETKLLLEQAAAMILNRLCLYAKNESKTTAINSLTLAVPSWYAPKAIRSLKDACEIAGLPQPKIISFGTALACLYGQKLTREKTSSKTTTSTPATPAATAAAAPDKVLVICIGHTSSAAMMLDCDSAKPFPAILAESSIPVGASDFHMALFKHVIESEQVTKKLGLKIKPNSRGARRLLESCGRCVKMLSTVSSAKLECEAVQDDKDISLDVSKDLLEQLCAPACLQLKEMIAKAVGEAGPATVIEVVGGGSRIPMVKALIASFVPGGEEKSLRYSLDSSSGIVQGACLYEGLRQQFANDAFYKQMDDENSKPLDAIHLAECALFEKEFCEIDEQSKQASLARNNLESLIIETRAAMESKEHAQHFDKDKVAHFLNTTEEWLYSDEDGQGERADLPALQAKLKSAKEELHKLAPAYYAAVEEAKQKKEKSLTEEAERAKREGGNEEDEDHDNRKLKTPDRMRLVKKNKDEGNELFSGSNYEQAMRRYLKALVHCDKFFDLSPEDKQEVQTVKLSLYLNIAQCCIKLESWKKCVENCKYALEVEPKSVKALYRMAVAQKELRQYDEAEATLTQAAGIDPNEQAVQKLLVTVKKFVAQEKEKQKKMYGKMFQ